MKPARILVVTLLLSASHAHADDQGIRGASFHVKNPGAVTKRTIQVVAKEKGLNSIYGDPVTNGAVLTLRANGTHPSAQTIQLPQGTNAKGKPFWTGNATKGFVYTDTKGAQGPVSKVQLKRSKSGVFTVTAKASGKHHPLAITPPNVGSDACLFLDIPGGDSYSVKFAAGDGTVVNKTTKQYTHKKVTTEGTCVPEVGCDDGKSNQNETDVDCGGPQCDPCQVGDSCLSGSDCVTGTCSGGVCQAPSCSDTVKNGNETDVDCGGTCPDCAVGSDCISNTDCATNFCPFSVCTCPLQSYTFTVFSSTGGAFDSAEWPGGTAVQSTVDGCSVTINRPDDNVDLTCSLADPFSINSFSGYSVCFANSGEDGDGCLVVNCPPAGSGQCCNGRPSCSAALNGTAQAEYRVLCSP